MSSGLMLGLALAAGAIQPPSPAAPSQLRATAGGIVAMAEAAERDGESATAEKLLAALLDDPSAEIRSEARFLLARLLVKRGRTADAAVLLRRVVDDNPSAAPARLELAAALSKLGRRDSALKELRALGTTALPPAMARMVDRWSAALQAEKPFGIQVELALAPDSNINRATRSDTLGTVIGDFTFDEDAKAHSGVGVALRGAATGRLGLSRSVDLVGRVGSDANLYRDRSFNEITLDIAAGPEARLGRVRASLDLGLSQLWYAMKPYQRSVRLAGAVTVPLDSRSQARVDGALRWTDNRVNELQDGRGWSLRARYDRALSPQLAVSASLGVDRFSAQDAAYSTRSWLAGVTAYRDIGRMTVSASAEYGRLKGDDRLALLPNARDEQLTRFGLGMVMRQLTVAGFAPIVRVTRETNRSTVEFYDYRRTRTEFGVTRAF